MDNQALTEALRMRQRAAWNQYLEDQDPNTKRFHDAMKGAADELARLSSSHDITLPEGKR
jgi:hypothetical protein